MNASSSPLRIATDRCPMPVSASEAVPRVSGRRPVAWFVSFVILAIGCGRTSAAEKVLVLSFESQAFSRLANHEFLIQARPDREGTTWTTLVTRVDASRSQVVASFDPQICPLPLRLIAFHRVGNAEDWEGLWFPIRQSDPLEEILVQPEAVYEHRIPCIPAQAEVRRLRVRINDPEGQPVPKADVEVRVYDRSSKLSEAVLAAPAGKGTYEAVIHQESIKSSEVAPFTIKTSGFAPYRSDSGPPFLFHRIHLSIRSEGFLDYNENDEYWLVTKETRELSVVLQRRPRIGPQTQDAKFELQKVEVRSRSGKPMGGVRIGLNVTSDAATTNSHGECYIRVLKHRRDGAILEARSQGGQTKSISLPPANRVAVIEMAYSLSKPLVLLQDGATRQRYTGKRLAGENFELKQADDLIKFEVSYANDTGDVTLEFDLSDDSRPVQIHIRGVPGFLETPLELKTTDLKEAGSQYRGKEVTLRRGGSGLLAVVWPSKNWKRYIDALKGTEHALRSLPRNDLTLVAFGDPAGEQIWSVVGVDPEQLGRSLDAFLQHPAVGGLPNPERVIPQLLQGRSALLGQAGKWKIVAVLPHQEPFADEAGPSDEALRQQLSRLADAGARLWIVEDGGRDPWLERLAKGSGGVYFTSQGDDLVEQMSRAFQTDPHKPPSGPPAPSNPAPRLESPQVPARNGGSGPGAVRGADPGSAPTRDPAPEAPDRIEPREPETGLGSKPL